MTILNATEARSKLYSLIDEAAESHPPIVKGKRGSAVLVSEEDWNAISETVNLLSIPGMRESIRAPFEPGPFSVTAIAARRHVVEGASEIDAKGPGHRRRPGSMCRVPVRDEIFRRE